MDNIKFREYQQEDNQYISKALCAIEDLEKDNITTLITADDFAEKISNWVTQIDSMPSNLIIIAEKEQEIYGFIIAIVEIQPNQFTQYQSHGLIQAIWVEPEFRKNGLGEALVNQALDSFAEFNIPYCDIAYHPDNKAAKQFWHKMGFNKSQITARKFLNKS